MLNVVRKVEKRERKASGKNYYYFNAYELTTKTFTFSLCDSLNRCKLKNLVGVILSREVHVKAGKLLTCCFVCNHHCNNS